MVARTASDSEEEWLDAEPEEETMLTTLMVALVILWLLGFSLHIGGGLIHALLVVALVLFVLNVLGGRRLV